MNVSRDAQRLWVAAELVRLQLRQARAMAVGSTVTMLFILLWFGPMLQWPRDFAWLFGIVLVRIVALQIPRGFDRLTLEQKIFRGRLFVGQCLVSGLFWAIGAGTIFTTQGAPEQWMFVAVFCGLGAAATVSQVAIPWSVPAFVLPTLLTIAFSLLWQGQPRALALLSLLLIYGVSLFLLHRGMYRELILGLRSRYANEQHQRTLRRQSDQLSALLRLKQFFITAASHDLRQPAQAIQLLARTVHDEAPTDSLRERTGALLKAADQFSDLINRLLDLARLDLSGERASPCWVRLSDVSRQLGTTLRPRAEQAGIDLSMAPPDIIEVRSDPLFLSRILQNLLSNAIDYSNARRVVLDVALPMTPDSSLEILVSDDGVGIDAAAARLLQSADSPLAIDDTSPTVRGLGLAIVARLARLEGHQLSVNASPGRGTTFRLRINGWRRVAARPPAPEVSAPRSGPTTATVTKVGERPRPDAADAAVPGRPPALRLVTPSGSPDDQGSDAASEKRQSESRNPRVVIVEDEPLVRLGLTAMLQANGFDCLHWLPGEPTDSMAEQGVVLILADWHLGSGETAADALPALQGALREPVPVLILTGLATLPVPAAELGTALGGAHVVTLQKPIDEAGLKRGLVRALHGHLSDRTTRDRSATGRPTGD